MTPTPVRHQYLRIKERHPDALLLFRLGDFYETFDQDAQTASRILGITLTGRDMGKDQRVPMAGIPYHSLDNHLGKLLEAGCKVAICEQTSPPAEGPGLLERDVVRVVTPGTVVESSLLRQKENNFLVAIVARDGLAGIAGIDITTSEFLVTQLPSAAVAPELERLRPSEVLYLKGSELPPAWSIAPSTQGDAAWFNTDASRERLLRQLGATTLEGYGCDHLPMAIEAAGAVLAYLGETQRAALAQVASLSTYTVDDYMALDPQTRRNLELFEGGRWSSADSSLLRVLDVTRTAMGGRMLRRWVGQPLLARQAIEDRHDMVAFLVKHPAVRNRLAADLSPIADLERSCNRVRGGMAGPRELLALRRSLDLVPEARADLSIEGSYAVAGLVARLKPCPEVTGLIREAIHDDAPAALSEGGVIRSGFSPELDNLRDAGGKARASIANLERQERERTGIKSLKVGYNRIFGYYIEISRANMAHVPERYVRKQTLLGGERFITPELKEYETLILNAEERMAELEAALFRKVCHQVGESAGQVLATAAAVAEADSLLSLAEVAVRHNYARPEMTEDGDLVILNGRHPVVERHAGPGHFVPNDIELSPANAQIVILTGPNMAGKSTYLRQAGLILLMAQMGSFVSADAARIGVVDRVFTRVGLQDDLSAGQSTFMVEMVETAAILNNATYKSLIILDEVGRGTSTYDGMAIARAAIEYIHNHPRLGAKTLFATHYHELTEMAAYLPRVRNSHVTVSEEGQEIVFLHRILPGSADKSYGVHVARMAGMPQPVVTRAREILASLEGGDGRNPPAIQKGGPAPQLSLFGAPSALEEELKDLNVASLTPLEAITKLFELQEKARRDGEDRGGHSPVGPGCQ